jgi:hypothetical protein
MSKCYSCQKECSKKNTLGCSLCKEPVLYCSEQCQSVGWARHQDEQCANIVNIPHKSVGLFVPYYGENLISDLKDFPLTGEPYQYHLLQHVDEKGVVYQGIASSLLNIDNENIELGAQELPEEHLKYNVTVSYLDEELEPLITKTTTELLGENTAIMESSMYKQNKALSELINNENGYVFWIKNLGMEFPTAGYLKLAINDTLAPMVGMYAFDDIDITKSWKPLQRKTPIQKINQIKYNNDIVPFNLETIRLANQVSGNQVNLTFEVPRDREGKLTDDTVKLVDIEYHVDENTFNNDSESISMDENDAFFNVTSFTTDANNLEQVTGLVAALSDRIADGTLSGNHIIKQYNLINNYRDQLENGSITTPSYQINAAVQQATKELWDKVGRSAAKRRLGKWSSNIRENRISAVEKAKNTVFARKNPDGWKEMQKRIMGYIRTAQVEQATGSDAGQFVARAKDGLAIFRQYYMKAVDSNDDKVDPTIPKPIVDAYFEMKMQYKNILKKEEEMTNEKKQNRKNKK